MSGVNWLPALRMPFDGLADTLRDCRVNYTDGVVIAVHLAYPGATATDRGKFRYDLPNDMLYAMQEAVDKVTADWQKEKRKVARNVDRRVRADGLAKIRKQRGTRERIKDAAYAVMAEAYAKAAGRVGLANARHVMYVARQLVIERTGGECGKDSASFTQVYLPDYRAEHPDDRYRTVLHIEKEGFLPIPRGPGFKSGSMSP